MRIHLTIALCLVGVLVVCGLVIAGSIDTHELPVGDMDEFHATDFDGLVPEAAVTYPAPVEKTGQTRSYASKDDGALRKGVAWPKPRFTDNKNGTVTDNLTGLIWLKNASCTKFYSGDSTNHNYRSWYNALTAANTLKSGYCGLSDGSVAGSWRLPNLYELESLRDMAYYFPALSNAAGTGKWTSGDAFLAVMPSFYWSSTTYAYYPGYAWSVYFHDGKLRYDDKPGSWYVWPVRGGQ